MKKTIKQIASLMILSVFLISCTTSTKNNNITLRKVSVLSEKDIYLPKISIKK
jgi:hypothetical protein